MISCPSTVGMTTKEITNTLSHEKTTDKKYISNIFVNDNLSEVLLANYQKYNQENENTSWTDMSFKHHFSSSYHHLLFTRHQIIMVHLYKTHTNKKENLPAIYLQESLNLVTNHLFIHSEMFLQSSQFHMRLELH